MYNSYSRNRMAADQLTSIRVRVFFSPSDRERLNKYMCHLLMICRLVFGSKISHLSLLTFRCFRISARVRISLDFFVHKRFVIYHSINVLNSCTVSKLIDACASSDGNTYRIPVILISSDYCFTHN